MTRILIAAGLAASLFATNLMAADLSAPLPPAKAAGVQKAQIFGIDTPLIVIVAGIGVAAAFILSNASNPQTIGNTVVGQAGPATST